jgi:hypothetical protein
MFRFILGIIAAYLVHAGAFYALTSPAASAVVGIPAPVVPGITSALLFVAVAIRMFFDSMNDEPLGDLRDSVGNAALSFFVPAHILQYLREAEPADTERTFGVESWAGSPIFLLVFYTFALYGAEPKKALGAGALALLAQLLLLFRKSRRWRPSCSAHRLGGPIR